MRRTIVAVGVALAACSGQESAPEAPREEASPQSEIAPPAVGPDINVTAAPGVAFNYQYALRLPAERIATVQEKHAAACEALGIARCRITGMKFQLVDAETIDGMLEVKLAPTIARAFGKRAVEAAVRDGATLTESEISGTDVGAGIEAGRKTEATLAEELAALQRQLARPGLGSRERAQLQQRIGELRDRMRQAEDSQESGRAALASTPMTFRYGSGSAYAGFGESRLMRALRDGGDNIVSGFAAIVYMAITLLPWAIAAALLALLVRFVRRRLRGAEI